MVAAIRSASAWGERNNRDSPYSTSALTANSPSAPPMTIHQKSAMSDQSSVIPKPMKNRPSNNPRNGSISVSNWWRNSLSASRTPAMNAPSAMDSPAAFINRAAQITTSNAADRNNSFEPVAAITLKNGRIRYRIVT